MSKTNHHGDKAKQRKFGANWRWMNTPSWWVNLMMTRPQRKAGKTWERQAATSRDVEELDTPSVSRKPHHYFW
jgi:hypothetical protein